MFFKGRSATTLELAYIQLAVHIGPSAATLAWHVCSPGLTEGTASLRRRMLFGMVSSPGLEGIEAGPAIRLASAPGLAMNDPS